MISSVTTLTAQKAHDKGLEFLVDVPPDVPRCCSGDPLRLGQILTNMVNNAVKFTEKGEIRLDIQLVERTGDKVKLKFSVQGYRHWDDKGTGGEIVPAVHAGRHVDHAETWWHGVGPDDLPATGGTDGRTIWLESEPGLGSTFYFSVWVGIGEAMGAGRLFLTRLRSFACWWWTTISAAREILQEPLNGLAKSDVVPWGAEAIAAIKRQDATEPYDVVFMDWRMPGMDGLQAAAHIKSG